MSLDREEWVRITDTSYADGVLTMKLTPPQDVVWIAYFAPYSMERHHDLVTQIAALAGRRLSLARQEPRRPGHRLPDHRRGPAQRLALRPPASRREHGRMVDGRRAREADRRGRSGRPRAAPRMHLPRRPQHEPRRLAPRPPAHQRRRREPQPRMACAVGREEPRSAVRPQCDGRDRRRFRDGRPRRRGDPGQLPRRLRGHPVARPTRQLELFNLFGETLERLSPDFQREQGYEIPAPGQANMSMSTTQLAERYGCVSMTLEMPFKDNFDLPDEVYGWSPQRSKYLAYACLDALHAILPELKAAKTHKADSRRRSTPDADAGPPAARPVAVEPREPLHRLVGRRPYATRASPRRAPPARCCATRASTSTAASPASSPAPSARCTWCFTRWTGCGFRSPRTGA